MTSSDRGWPTRRLVIGGLAFVACVAASPAALAQRSAGDIESARRLYTSGIELRDKGDLPGALEKFRAAHALGNTPITGLELCKTHAALRQPVEAREVCLSVGRIPQLAGETARSQAARAEASQLAEHVSAKISGLRLRILGLSAGQVPTVTVDGAEVPPAALAEVRAMDPGSHVVVARVGSGEPTHATIDLPEGKTQELELTVTSVGEPARPALTHTAPSSNPAPVGEPPAERPAATPRSRLSPVAKAGFIVGGIGLGIGAVTGIVAIVMKKDLDDRCDDERRCGPAEHDTLGAAKGWGNASTAFFVVGGAGILTGVIAAIVQPRASTTGLQPTTWKAGRARIEPWVSGGSVGVHGTF